MLNKAGDGKTGLEEGPLPANRSATVRHGVQNKRPNPKSNGSAHLKQDAALSGRPCDQGCRSVKAEEGSYHPVEEQEDAEDTESCGCATLRGGGQQHRAREQSHRGHGMECGGRKPGLGCAHDPGGGYDCEEAEPDEQPTNREARFFIIMTALPDAPHQRRCEASSVACCC